MAITLSIAVTNRSSVLTDAEIQAWLPAMQHQANYHFGPYYNTGARLHFAPNPDAVPLGMARIEVLDDSDQAGALGYHDETATGTPEALIFARTDQQYGLSVTVTFTHELLELLADVRANLCAQFSTSQFWAYEVCDAVEDDSFGYNVTYGTLPPVLCTDFVLPKWFEPGSQTSKWDYKGHCKGPGEILNGGYMAIFVSGKGWTQVQNFDGEMKDVTRPSADGFQRERPSQEMRVEYAKWKAGQ